MSPKGFERDLAKLAELMERAEERKSEYLREWLKDPAFRAALHNHDEEALRRKLKPNPTDKPAQGWQK